MLLAAVILFPLGQNRITRSKRITLEKFYQALYVDADLQTMRECLFEGYREKFENAMTLAGTNEDFYLQYHDEAVKLFGEEVNVLVQVKSNESVPYEGLLNLKKAYRQISDARKVTYDIIFMCGAGKGENNRKKVFFNSLYIVRVGWKWYMGTHLTLPVGKNIYAY